MTNLQNLINKYIDGAKKYGVAFEVGGNSRDANKQFDIVENVKESILLLGEVGEQAIIDLINHDEPYVRLWAASHCLQLDLDEINAMNCLKELAGSRGLLGFWAGQILSEWNKK